MMLLFLAAVIIPVIILFLFQKHKRLPPGPPGLPLIGNLHQLINTANPHIYLWNLSKKYGPLISMKLGRVPVLVVSSPRIAKEVLKTHDLVFSGRPKFLGQHKISYNGLDVAFATYSESWRELRKIVVLHLLSNKQVQSFRPIREQEVFGAIKNIISVTAGNHNQAVVNLSEKMLYFTGTLICQIAFGKKFDDGALERRRFDKLMLESQVMQGGLFVTDYLPLFGWVDKVSGMISRLEKNFKDFDEIYQELIDYHLDSSSPKSVNPHILGLLIQLKEENSCSIDLTWDQIKGILTDILIAGTDTGAATIIWAMTALIKNPNAMKNLQKEIRDLIGLKGHVTEDDLPKLSYLKAVIKETLRLYPPAPLLLPRETLEECTLEGYKIAPKTLVYINAWAIARDPEYWENPDGFVPERFLNTKVDIIGQDYEVIPFGSGRRKCPGISLGLATVELMLANLVYSFDWELPSGVEKEDIDTDVLPGITMHKKNPLCLVPKTYLSSPFEEIQ